MKYDLRYYQKESANEAVRRLRSGDGKPFILLMATGAGKSLVIADICHQLDAPTLILQPSKEILEQNYNKLKSYGVKDVSMYSASMNSKEIAKYTYATIQSIYRKPELFKHFKYVLLDECHGLNPKNKNGMLTTFLEAIGCRNVCGLTATPYRMSQKYFNENGQMYYTSHLKMLNRIYPFFFKSIAYKIETAELIEQGFLSPIVYRADREVDLLKLQVNSTGADFTTESLDEFWNDTRLKKMARIIQRIDEKCQRNLIFCSSLRQARRAKELIDILLEQTDHERLSVRSKAVYTANNEHSSMPSPRLSEHSPANQPQIHVQKRRLHADEKLSPEILQETLGTRTNQPLSTDRNSNYNEQRLHKRESQPKKVGTRTYPGDGENFRTQDEAGRVGASQEWQSGGQQPDEFRTVDRNNTIWAAGLGDDVSSLQDALLNKTSRVAIVDGKTPIKERERIISEFKAGRIKHMINVGVFTTGFDVPELDCVVIARPTMSLALYYQMVGRGVRLDPARPDKVLHVYDLAGVVAKLGRIETIRVVKEADGWKDMVVSEVGQMSEVPLFKYLVKKKVFASKGN